MTAYLTWLAAFATVTVLVLYELRLVLAQRRSPEQIARSAHATLRQDWFAAISAHEGTGLQAVCFLEACVPIKKPGQGEAANPTVVAPRVTPFRKLI